MSHVFINAVVPDGEEKIKRSCTVCGAVALIYPGGQRRYINPVNGKQFINKVPECKSLNNDSRVFDQSIGGCIVCIRTLYDELVTRLDYFPGKGMAENILRNFESSNINSDRKIII